MMKRMVLMLGAVLTFIVLVATVKFFQFRAAMAQQAAFALPPEAVTTSVARAESWPRTLHVAGSATAVQGVTVTADLPGIVDHITFESGRSVKAGDILVQLDVRQEEAQLVAA